jgi:hypothetical protein
MAQTPGYLASLATGGTSTAFSNEATTKVTANTVYRITDATKRVLDPTVTPTVEVDPNADGNWEAAGSHTVDYYTGTVTFGADQGATALVRVSGNYIPILEIATARGVTYRIERDVLDCTVLNTTGYRSYKQGLARFSVTLDLHENLLEDHDSGAGTQKLATKLTGASIFLFRLRMSNSGRYLVAWMRAASGGATAEVAGLVTSNFEAQAAGYGSAAVIGTYTA